METIDQIRLAKQAKKSINTATSDEKNKALRAMADTLVDATADILAANQLDMEAAQGRISEVMLDRLLLTEERIQVMADGILQVAALPDPVGELLEERTLENGLVIQKKRVAMGVIGIIYESRPNVTSDAAALALKSGSAVVLRSGKDAYQTAHAIVNALKTGLQATTIDPAVLQLVEDTSRESSLVMMKAKGDLDLLIPRGGAGLIQAVVEQAIVPVIETGTGIVHVYVDQAADLDKALSIIQNAKTSRPSVCNAMEVLLVHEAIAGDFLPLVKKFLVDEAPVPVEMRLDAQAQQIINGSPASETDFDTEFLDYVMAVKVVPSVEEAIAHIEAHSTHHSDAIISEDARAIEAFSNQVDSAAVYVNASTRFTDGGEFGLGCEMGISTQKLHARGPMGLRELTSYKYLVTGNGQVSQVMKVAFIGLGNMGASLAKAVAKEVAAQDLLLINRTPQKVQEFIGRYGGTASDLEQAFKEAEVIFLGVKPYQICPLLEEYQTVLSQRSDLLLVSMAAGLELDKIAGVVKNDRVGLIRIMPNTPVAIGQGVISLARSQAVTDQQVTQVNQLLAGAGALYEIEEKLMDPATAVAGCGPAFVYQMIEAMADAGVSLGLSREQALQMAAQTFQGASQMVLETGEHPARLRDAVCSPGGSTIAGVNRLEQVGLRGDIIAGVEAAYKRTQEMGQEVAKK